MRSLCPEHHSWRSIINHVYIDNVFTPILAQKCILTHLQLMVDFSSNFLWRKWTKCVLRQYLYVMLQLSMLNKNCCHANLLIFKILPDYQKTYFPRFFFYFGNNKKKFFSKINLPIYLYCDVSRKFYTKCVCSIECRRMCLKRYDSFFHFIIFVFGELQCSTCNVLIHYKFNIKLFCGRYWLLLTFTNKLT